MKTESVIDFPKDGLCPDIWEKVIDASGNNEVWHMIPEVHEKLMNIFNMIVQEAKVPTDGIKCHITGSITSNSYNKNADIDMHILLGVRIREMNEMTQKRFRNAFKITCANNPGSDSIGSHPIEVYYQDNEFQDFMSVGCYELTEDKWLVGPELTDQSFNPYSEYYEEIRALSEKHAQKIRNMIFSIYEIAVVLKKNYGTEFEKQIRTILISKLQEVQALYDELRQTRKVYSSPTSMDQALEFRSSRKWKIADASFKLFDKYGYTAILKQFIEDAKLIQMSDSVDQEVVEDILSTVKNYINNADKLAEKELYEDEFDGEDDENPYKNVFQHPDKSKLPKFLYHLSAKKNAELIRQNGITPRLQSKEKTWEQSDSSATYWSRSILKAEEFMKGNNDLVYIRVPTSEFNMSKLFIDRNAMYDFDLEISFEYHDSISPLVIEFMSDTEVKQQIDIEYNMMNSGELQLDDNEQVNEGPFQNVAMAAIVALLTIPGIANAKEISKAVQNSKTYEQANKTLAATVAVDKIGSYSTYQVTNIISRTLFAEAQNQSKEGMKAVCDTIFNRAGGKPEKFVDMCLQHAYSSKAKKDVYQYSCWSSINMSKMQPKTYQLKVPKAAQNNIEMWDYARELAAQMVSGKYKANSTRNSYYNPDKCSPDWGDLMTDVKVIGDHKFGYLPEHDGFRRGKVNKLHIVKKGDSLWKIAKRNNTTAQELAKKNNIKIDSILQLGQKIKI